MNNNITFDNMFLALEQSSISIILTDPLGNIVYANKQFYEITGYSEKETVGKNPNILSSGNQSSKFFEEMWDKLKSGEKWKGRIQNRKKSGELFWEKVSITPLFDHDNNLINYIATQDDITQKVQQEQNLELMDDLLNYDKSLGVSNHFTTLFAKDFNHIFSGISNLIELIERTQNGLDDRGTKYISLLKASAKKAEDLSIKLSLFDEKLKPIFEEVDLGYLYNRFIKNSVHSNKDINIEYSGIEQLFTLGSKAEIYHLFNDIIENSIEAITSDGLISVSLSNKDIDKDLCKSSLITAEPGNYHIFSVEDNGCGIHKAELNKVFEPFYTTSSNKINKGLGLTAVKKCMIRLKGAIYLSSTMGQGTKIELCFPKYLVKEQESKKNSNNEVLTILFVDDEEVNRIVASDSLEILGYKVLTANDGEEAIEVFKNNYKEIDLVLLDMVMPKLTGLEAFSKMKSIDSGCKALVVTGFSDYINREDLKEIGISGIIVKPYSALDLDHIIQKTIRGK